MMHGQKKHQNNCVRNKYICCAEAYVYCIYSTQLYTLQVRMSTSGVFMYYRWWGCQSAKPWKYTVL